MGPESFISKDITKIRPKTMINTAVDTARGAAVRKFEELQALLKPDEYDFIPTIYHPLTDILRITIQARELTSQKGYPRGVDAIQTGNLQEIGSDGNPREHTGRAIWRFLAPMEIAENTVHEWTEYESVATRLAQTVSNIHRGKSAIEQTVQSAHIAGHPALGEGKADIEGGKALLQKAADHDLTGILNHRVDSTLVYSSSTRRQYTLTFPLAVYGGMLNQRMIFEGIRKLQKLSCPDLSGDDMIKIRLPAVFCIRTDPSPLILVNYAALTGVQPMWKGPYKNGYPMRVDLQLTFQDIEPLYRRSYEKGGIVKVGDEEDRRGPSMIDDLKGNYL